jgi:hypothetical protein
VDALERASQVGGMGIEGGWTNLHRRWGLGTRKQGIKGVYAVNVDINR